MAPGELTCWSCGHGVSRSVFDRLSVLHGRAEHRGGPYLSFRCPECREIWICEREKGGAIAVFPPTGGLVLDTLAALFDPWLRRRLAKIKSWLDDREREGGAEPGARGPASPETAHGNGKRQEPNVSASHHEQEKRWRGLLGISATASKQELKKAYLTRAKESHPDLHATRSEAERLAAHRRFVDIVEAYEGLGRIHDERGASDTEGKSR
jgi:hypothetical protein